MLSCKDLNSLVVLSLYEGELLGVVNKLFFNKNLKKLQEIEIIAENGAKLMLETKKIYHIGNNAITIKNNQLVKMRSPSDECCASPTFSKAYNIKGEFLGVVQEIKFNEKFQTQEIMLDNSNIFNVDNIVTCGKNTIIFDAKPNVMKLKKTIFKVAKNKKQDDIKSPVLEKENDKSVQDNSFLIGRKCLKDIYNFNNEIIIKANSIVNRKNLKEINKFGKIKELMLYLK